MDSVSVTVAAKSTGSLVFVELPSCLSLGQDLIRMY